MELVSVNPQPEPAALARVRIMFVDGSTISISNVIDVDDDEINFVVTQNDGDYIKIPIDNNVRLLEVSFV